MVDIWQKCWLHKRASIRRTLLIVSQQYEVIVFRAWLRLRTFLLEKNMSVELGEQLRELRLLRTYYTQAQVAELLSIDRSSYTRYEMGTTEPPI
ncbi:MAG: helix-turn-helix domain-containing protein, partial [Ruminococcus sp.]|nr:helix-turn-helix domain-containing protein [Ruminococcus sp.]